MKNWWMAMTHHFYGTNWIALTNVLGEIRFRRVIFIGKIPFADWTLLATSRVCILPSGEFQNGSNVKSWEPIYPSVPIWHPEWEDAEVVPLHKIHSR